MLTPSQVEGSAYRFPRGWTLTRRDSYESNATKAAGSSSAIMLQDNNLSQSAQATSRNITDDPGLAVESGESLQASNHHLF